MKKIRGRFYFRKTDNANLLGEYSHDQLTRAFTESADLISSDGSEFGGTYIATWHENSGAVAADLTIKPKAGSNNKLWELEWTYPSGSFVGEAMLCEGMLVGDYHSAP